MGDPDPNQVSLAVSFCSSISEIKSLKPANLGNKVTDNSGDLQTNLWRRNQFTTDERQRLHIHRRKVAVRITSA